LIYGGFVQIQEGVLAKQGLVSTMDAPDPYVRGIFWKGWRKFRFWVLTYVVCWITTAIPAKIDFLHRMGAKQPMSDIAILIFRIRRYCI